MSDLQTVQKLNRELAAKLSAEGRNNPHAPYYGKFVGIANGEIAVVANDLNELYRALLEKEPDPRRCFGVEVGRDYEQMHEIWSSAVAS